MKNTSRQNFIKTCALLLGGNLLINACGNITPGLNQVTTAAPNPTVTVISPTLVATSPSVTDAATASTNQAPTTITKAATVSTTTVPPNSPSPDRPTVAPTITTPPASQYKLDLATKVGQRLLVTLPGTSLTTAVKDFLLAVKPGGILMFASNISSLNQIKKFNADLQALAAANNLPPFIITLDEEGGIVNRMPADGQAAVAPSQMAQAAAGLNAIRDCAYETGARLANLGFNLNLAPVADVNSNYLNPVIGTRSYGGDPNQVATAISAAIEQYQKQGVGTCVKHFPGHGDTATDSHTGLPIVRKSLDDLKRLELIPFVAAIAAGTPAIMTAHILYPQIEPQGLPATLSPFFLKQLLRDQLNFEGLIITDALNMDAISNKYGLAQAALLSVQAGADMVMLISDLNGQRAVFNSLLMAATQGAFEVDKSAERSLAYKATLVRPVATKAENPAKIAAAAQSAITALRFDNHTLPLPITGQKLLLINFALDKPSPVEGQPPTTLFGELWRTTFAGQPSLEVSVNPTTAEVGQVVKAAQTADKVILVTRDAFDNDLQGHLVQTLLATNPATIVVAVRSPYDLMAFPHAPNYLTTYSDVPASDHALLAALIGKAHISGKLPVNLPGLYNIGAGLQLG